MSQWRSSWLSREGLAAIATYLPAAALGFGWLFGEVVPGQFAFGAALSVLGALGTVWCTGMIYGSLPTIRAWNQPLVAPVYHRAGARDRRRADEPPADRCSAIRSALGRAIAPLLALVIGAILKRLYWTAIDTAAKTYTAEAATGLGRFGTVRPLDPPHTQPNFVMREMGYQVARRHAERLRRLSVRCCSCCRSWPEGFCCCNLPNSIQIAIAALSALSAVAGVLTERWLFFAEAEHVVMVFTAAVLAMAPYYRNAVAENCGDNAVHPLPSMSGMTTSSGISMVQTRPAGS